MPCRGHRPFKHLTQRCCDGVPSHSDEFLRTDQFTVASHCQVQGHRFTDEGKVSLLGTADALLHVGHKALLALHVLVDAAVHRVVGILGHKIIKINK